MLHLLVYCLCFSPPAKFQAILSVFSRYLDRRSFHTIEREKVGDLPLRSAEPTLTFRAIKSVKMLQSIPFFAIVLSDSSTDSENEKLGKPSTQRWNKPIIFVPYCPIRTLSQCLSRHAGVPTVDDLTWSSPDVTKKSLAPYVPRA